MDYIKFIMTLIDFIVAVILNLSACILLLWRIFSHTEVPVKNKELQFLLICIVACFFVYLIYAFFTKSIAFNILLILLPTCLWFEGFKTSLLNKGNTYIDLIDKVAFSMIALCLTILLVREITKLIKLIRLKSSIKN